MMDDARLNENEKKIIPMRAFVTMNSKAVIAVVCAVAIVASGAAAAVFLIDAFKKEKEIPDLSEWDCSKITNFEKYSYLCDGYVRESASSVSGNAGYAMKVIGDDAADAEEEVKKKLIGITGDGSAEIITFEDQDGNPIDQDATLVYLSPRSFYTVVTYVPDEAYDDYMAEIHKNPFYNESDSSMPPGFTFFQNDKTIGFSGGRCNNSMEYYVSPDFHADMKHIYVFIIDNENGDMYCLNTFAENYRRDNQNLSYAEMIFTGTKDYEDYGYIFVRAPYEYGETGTYLKFGFSDHRLVAETLMDEEQTLNFGNPQLWKFDRYGNIFSMGNGGYNYFNVKNGQYKIFDVPNGNSDSYHLNFNRVMCYRMTLYDDNFTKYVDENGNLMDATLPVVDRGTKIIALDDSYYVISKTDNSPYKLVISQYQLDPGNPALYSLSSPPTESEAYTQTEVTNCISNAILMDDERIYTFANDILIVFDTNMNTMTQMTTDYIFKSISTDSTNKAIKVDAVVKSTMKNISGYIDIENVDSGVLVMDHYDYVVGDKVIYTLAPVNRR